MERENTIIPEKHVSLTSAKDVTIVCAPLFKNTEIDFFIYGRTYPDNSLVVLDTYPEWHDFLYRKRCGKDVISHEMLEALVSNKKNLFNNKSNQVCLLVDELAEKYSPYIKMLKKFKLESYLFFIEKLDNYGEFFGFASRSGKNITPSYFSNYEFLEKFMLYFKEYGANIIAENEKDRIILPRRSTEFEQFVNKLPEQLNQTGRYLQNLNNILQLRKYPLSCDGNEIYITARELECLHNLSEGNSWKEIGNIMNISPRTVESYLGGIKAKLGVHTKGQLLDVFRSSKLSSIRFK